MLFQTELTITFGELLHAIFWEIGLHGSPVDRDAAWATAMLDRLEEHYLIDGRAALSTRVVALLEYLQSRGVTS
ncbi:MAG: hypothetical protein A2Z17_03950 [Gammaproteobacteria bacterium RBG_16_66_13]|nr:MAG: hypothetical protein A2Z17_03950 [Gammaproteobacteria bacterium RBG_16_66_13]